MILLSGADVVLPDRVFGPATVALEGDRIAEVASGTRRGGTGAVHVDLSNHYLVPGFIDVHVHGLEGTDTLDGEEAIAAMASRLPRFGVTAFCPTSIACAPAVLRRMLAAIRRARTTVVAGAARVLPAHLESNFINPEYKGAQPLECLRLPPRASASAAQSEGEFTGADILAEIHAARPDVGILTIAPELDGAPDLIRDLTSKGHHVSLGHSGATYDQALAGIEAGARQATHLFNRMPPVGHRAPGLAGAVLEREEVATEIVCDGIHVHPAMVRVAIGAKRPSGVMAITDGTAGAGLPSGSVSSIGGRRITIGEAAYLDDGTLAGSVLTLNRAFAKLVTLMGCSLVEASIMCSTTPARALGLHGLGVVAVGATADLAVLDRDLNVVQTYIAGTKVWDAVSGPHLAGSR
jgi:N-acetylglucosamine-6-phosphate deacetylase